MPTNNALDLSDQIKLIVTDVDGTLVDSHRALPDINIEAFRTAHQKGIPVVVATGRPLDGILPDIETWGLDDVITHVVANNGADIYSYIDGSTRHLHFIPSDKAIQLLDRYGNWDVAICRYLGQTLLTNKVNADYIQRSNYAHLAMQTVDMHDYLTDDQPKMLMIAPSASLEAIVSDYANHGIDPIKLVHCEHNLIEVLHKDLSKVSGVDVIASNYGINHDQILSFGDTTNDLEMISTYHGVAVDNAVDTIKQAARYITLSNDEGGVGRFILDYVIH